MSGAGGLYLTQGRDIGPALPFLRAAGDFRKQSALMRVRIAVLGRSRTVPDPGGAGPVGGRVRGGVGSEVGADRV